MTFREIILLVTWFDGKMLYNVKESHILLFFREIVCVVYVYESQIGKWIIYSNFRQINYLLSLLKSYFHERMGKIDFTKFLSLKTLLSIYPKGWLINLPYFLK